MTDHMFNQFAEMGDGPAPSDDPQAMSHCPECMSIQLDGGPVRIEGSLAYQHCTCLKCGNRWEDYYRYEGWM